MKKLFMLLMLPLFGVQFGMAQSSETASDNKVFQVTGRLAEPFTGKIYLSYIKDRLENLDTVILENGTDFFFERAIPHADVYRVRSRPYLFDISVLAEPGGKYEVAVDAKKQSSLYTVQGEEQTLYAKYGKLKNDATGKQAEELYKQLAEAETKKDTMAIERLSKEVTTLFEKTEEEKMAYIRFIPHTFAGVVLAGELLLYTYPQLREVYQSLDTVTYRNTSSFRSFMQKYKEAEDKWIQNRPAPDFITRDMQGREVRLSDFKGHYVLLDFWASLCRPCRIKAKELKKQIKELEKRGIQVCGISMDDKRELWEKATSEDGIIWTNTSELKPFKLNSIATSYKVTQLPTLFLIDPQGMIVKQNPSIDDLLRLKCVK